MKKITLITLLVLLTSIYANAKPWDHGKLVVSPDKHHIQHEDDGKGFFWLGDTAWTLFSKLSQTKAIEYFNDRHNKKYSVIQIMAAEFHPKDEDNTSDTSYFIKNYYGESPFNSESYTYDDYDGSNYGNHINEKYWKNVDDIISYAAGRGLYVALLPSWDNSPLTKDNANMYGKWIANRYKDKPNIIWVLGGDLKNESLDEDDEVETWKVLGRAIRLEDPNHLITLHVGGPISSSKHFHNEDWLDFNMIQTSHCPKKYLDINKDTTDYIKTDYSKQPPKPTINGEPLYEDIKKCYGNKWLKNGVVQYTPGYEDYDFEQRGTASDVRAIAYRDIFAGAFGHTYGNLGIFTFHQQDENGTDLPDYHKKWGTPKVWTLAIDDPGSNQMQYVAKLIKGHNVLDLVPDNSIVVGGNTKKIIATRDKNGKYAYVYVSPHTDINLDLTTLEASYIKASWYDPRNGEITEIDTYSNSENNLVLDSKDSDEDWVILLEEDTNAECWIPIYTGDITIVVPCPPTNQQVKKVGTKSATVTWNGVSNASKYKILVASGQQNGTRSIIVNKNIASYQLDNLEESQEYTYEIRSLNEAGQSSSGAKGTFTTKLAAPTNLTAYDIESDTAKIYFNDNSLKESGFYIYDTSGKLLKTLSNHNGKGIVYAKLTNLKSNQYYGIYAVAYYNSKESDKSPIYTFKTKKETAALTTPTSGTLGASTTFRWKKNDAYEVSLYFWDVDAGKEARPTVVTSATSATITMPQNGHHIKLLFISKDSNHNKIGNTRHYYYNEGFSPLSKAYLSSPSNGSTLSGNTTFKVHRYANELIKFRIYDANTKKDLYKSGLTTKTSYTYNFSKNGHKIYVYIYSYDARQSNKYIGYKAYYGFKTPPPPPPVNYNVAYMVYPGTSGYVSTHQKFKWNRRTSNIKKVAFYVWDMTSGREVPHTYSKKDSWNTTVNLPKGHKIKVILTSYDSHGRKIQNSNHYIYTVR